MNTSEIVAAIAESQDLTQVETRELLDAVVQTLTDSLADGHRFTIPELGTFEVHTREKRRSYNPNANQYMMLPPKRVVSFKAGHQLKEKVK